MARPVELSVNDVFFVGDTSPARDQLEILNIVSNNGLLPLMDAGVSDLALAAGMSSLSVSTTDRLRELVFRKGKFTRVLDGVPVSENLFQDEIHFYLILLARCIEKNIGPFWLLRKSGEGGDETTLSPHA